ncbi:MAG: low molecular weight phosphotyrosine protein phosphatase [Alphaproteobacteria bacterium]|nr:low molecular weight phosphotyrosine protein phosphatase [Alphaproteobacteria bacterium]MCB9795686.1 low molecular weight phosphotyrosine protein phosphatase [Alphaproteobacteria bacterium]
MPTRLLMVCTGNICRSPMAEGLARHYAAQRGRALEVASASVLGLDGQPAHKLAVKVMKELGIDISAHRAQPVTPELVEEADYILVMELAHAAELRDRYPEADDRILLLGTFGGKMELEDPIHGWRWRFRRSRDDIRRCVESFIDQLPAEAP